MTDEKRKGAFTPEQEKTLDKVAKFSGAWERLDGPAITIVDNQVIERILTKAEEKHPGVREEVVYPVIDVIMEALETMVSEEDGN